MQEVNELGLWRRRAPTPPQQEPLLIGNKGATARSCTAQDTSKHMSKRYTQGTGRVGRVQRQMRVMNKFVSLIARALKKFGKAWTSLPPGRKDLQILKKL